MKNNNQSENQTYFDFHVYDQKIQKEDYLKNHEITGKDDNKWLPFLSFPITKKCNFNCIYCGHGGEATASKKNVIDINTIFDITNAALTKGIRKFRITGGEPFMHPHIDEILQYFSNLGRFTLINTNASLIQQHASIIREIGENIKFAVSFDTMKPELLHKISKSNLHENVLGGIKLLSETGHLLRLNMVVGKYNYDEITDIISLCQTLNCDLKLLDIVSVPVPYGKRQDVYQEISTLEEKFANTCDSIYVHEYTRGFGTPCNRYKFGNTLVTVKNSVKGSHYDREDKDSICKDCPYFPCHEGIYDIFALSDGKLCACRWTEEQKYESIGDQIDYLIKAYKRSKYYDKKDNDDMPVRIELSEKV